MYEWLLAGLSIWGTWFNLQKRVAGWIIWTVANAGWVASFIVKGLLAEATLFSVYLFLSLYGIYKWRKPEPVRESTINNHPPC